MAATARVSDPPKVDAFDLDQLAALVAVAPLLDLHGRAASLRESWRSAPTVTGFVRHFGCLFCHEMVDTLVAAIPEIQSRGARLVVVGNGNVDQARHFFERRGLPRSGVEVFTDPGRNSYATAGFERGVARTFLVPAVWSGYRRARASGQYNRGVFGDLTQLGGTFVTRPPARLSYVHRSRFAGDHPDLAEVLSALPAQLA